MRRALRRAGIGVSAALLATAALGGGLRLMWSMTDAPPESATGWQARATVSSPSFMVVAAHPRAAAAGREILAQGGSAIDAVIATQLALTVVEPQSSGIGGGAFMLYWDARAQKLTAHDGRETAPAAARPDLFLDADGDPFDFVSAVVGGRSVGVPGVLRMLESAHRQHGRLPWAALFAPAIALAKDGFAVTPRLHQLSRRDPLLRTTAAARAHFYADDGRAWPVGHVLVNAPLAAVFEEIQRGGADAFYRGPLARDIVRAVQDARRPGLVTASLNFVMTMVLGAPYALDTLGDVPNPGLLTEADLAAYTPVEREPLCVDLVKARACAFGPPTGGGLAVLQILAMLEPHRLERFAPRSVEAMHLLLEAERLAYADRDRYVADPDFVQVPVQGLLDPAYLAERSGRIALERAAANVQAGTPPQVAQGRFADDPTRERAATSHLCVVDAEGNLVTMTTSIENVFGSRVMVRGFLLNNQLTDFAFVPERDGRPVAYAVAPGKRPRSSMAPVVLFDRTTGQPIAALGSPGGGRIIAYVAQTALGMLHWGLSPEGAIALPHVVGLDGRAELEDIGWSEAERDAVAEGLTARGHRVELMEQNSGLHAVARGAAGWTGGADPRREGVALGP